MCAPCGRALVSYTPLAHIKIEILWFYKRLAYWIHHRIMAGYCKSYIYSSGKL